MDAGGFVALTSALIYDWRSFHRESQRSLGFPADYAGDMDAWVDCLVSLRDEENRRVGVHLAPDEMLQIELAEIEAVRERVPGILETLVDATAEVNRRFVEAGQPPAVTLIFV
ncbi:MAG: barstar family protein [Gemmatimonadaceae bacterium]